MSVNCFERMTNQQLLIGSLLYAARPDIAHVVLVFSKSSASPKRVLLYIKGTKQYGIKYKKTNNATVTGYTDANWAGDLDDRHSTSGMSS